MSCEKANAIHIPGETVEQMKAEKAAREAHDNVPRHRMVLSKREMADFEVASGEAQYAVENAANIFAELHSGIASGNMNPQSPGLMAILDMTGRGFRTVAEKEGEALLELSTKIRSLGKGEQ